MPKKMHIEVICFKIRVLQVLQVNTFFYFLFRYLSMTLQMKVMISTEEIQAKVKELGKKLTHIMPKAIKSLF